MLILKIKNKVINRIGCIVARWILHNCADGLVIRQKGGAEQMSKCLVFPDMKETTKIKKANRE